MKKRAVVSILAVLVLASFVSAQSADPEKRFHEAYVMEVIEGRVAEAAKVYLDLMEDESAPARIRAEAKFRFAISAVLLGRPDEARARFAELLADPGISDALRARAEEYRKAAEGIGVGTELDKKLDELVFALGRTGIYWDKPPEVYRDFEIIGKPAVPFLRKLLGHQDADIRKHAFMILCRMGEPGMVDAWTPEFVLGFRGPGVPFGAWLEDRPEEFRKLEARLLELDAETLHWNLISWHPHPPYSIEFVRAAIGKMSGSALDWVQSLGRSDVGWTVLEEWIREGEPELAADAARTWLDFVGRHTPRDHTDPELFNPIVRALAGRAFPWFQNSGRLNSNFVLNGMKAYLVAMDAPALVTALRELLGAEVTGMPERVSDPLENNLADWTLGELLKRPDAEVDPEALAPLLRGWAERVAIQGWSAELRGGLRYVLRHLPEAEAIELVRWYVPLATPIWSRSYAALPYKKPARIPVLLAAFDAADREHQDEMVSVFPLVGQVPVPESDVETVRTILDLYPHLLEVDHKAVTGRLMAVWPGLAAQVSADVAEASFEKIRAVAEGLSPECRREFVQPLLRTPSSNQLTSIFTDLVPRRFGELEAVLPEESNWFVQIAISWLSLAEDDRMPLSDGARRTLILLLLDHLDTYRTKWFLPEEIWAANDDVVPLTELVSRAPADVWNAKSAARLDPDAADEAARDLTRDPAGIGDPVLRFVRNLPREATAKEIAERLFKEESGETLRRVFSELSNLVATETLEKTLADALAADSPDAELVWSLTEELVSGHPTEKLFPAVRFLLSSDRRDQVQSGIAYAKRLGRKELLPPLVEKLDSMDPSIRNAAREAMDSILTLERLKQEAQK